MLDEVVALLWDEEKEPETEEATDNAEVSSFWGAGMTYDEKTKY